MASSAIMSLLRDFDLITRCRNKEQHVKCEQSITIW